MNSHILLSFFFSVETEQWNSTGMFHDTANGKSTRVKLH